MAGGLVQMINPPAPRRRRQRKLKGGAKVAAPVKAYVNKAITSHEEKKRHRFLTTAGLVNGTTVYHALMTNNIQGDDDLQNHLGDKLKISYLLLKGFIPAAPSGSAVRLIIFTWKLLSTTAPTDSVLFDDISTTNTRIWGAVNQDVKKSSKVFKVIYDRIYYPDSVRGTIPINIKKKLVSNVQFDAGTSNCWNMPHMLLLSNVNISPLLYCNITYTSSG